MSTKPYIFHSLSACAGCGCSGDDFGSVNVEAFELTGELYCEECADEAIEGAEQDAAEAGHVTARMSERQAEIAEHRADNGLIHHREGE